MPKQIDWNTIEQAYMSSGDTLENVAAQFGVSERAIKGKASDGNWSNRRKAKKVVPIGESKPKNREDVRIVRERKSGDIDELEILDLALTDLSADLSMGGEDVDIRAKAAVAGALCKLIELRLKLKPRTAAQVAAMTIGLGLQPQEFIAELRRYWSLEKQA